MSKNQWVVPHDDGWAVRGEGNQRLTETFDRKADAFEAGRRIAMNQHSELIVQRQDGTIQERRSYGHDPFPPRDKD
jgi:hypothetical protein